MSHSAVSTAAMADMAARFALGLGEAANFPAGIKAIAEWFPRRERALAAGLFNAGTNIGALTAPLLVPWLTLSFGWQWAFVATGALGFAWLLLWLGAYRPPAEHPRVRASELAHIRSDPAEAPVRIPWLALLRHRQTWVFAVGKFITDPVWWLYIFWIPDFLHRNYGLDLSTIGPPLVVIFLAADAGSVAGGWLSSHLIARGWSVNAARKTTMLTFALLVLPVGMRGDPDSCGVWAPCLTYDDGRFYLIYTDVKRYGRTSIAGASGASLRDFHNYLVTSERIDGEWSDPVYLNSSGFDPSLFHDDDGRKYLLNMLWDHRPGQNRFAGIVLQEYSPREQRLIGERHTIFSGTAIGFTEGPHLYRRAGWYHLLTAEGGTGWGHAVTMARATTIEGPYDLHPEVPMPYSSAVAPGGCATCAATFPSGGVAVYSTE